MSSLNDLMFGHDDLSVSLNSSLFGTEDNSILGDENFQQELALDGLLTDSITVEDILNGMNEEKSKEMFTSSVSESVGNQTLNDLLNSTVPPPTYHSPQITTDQDSCAKVTLAPPSSPEEVKPLMRLSNIQNDVTVPSTYVTSTNMFSNAVPSSNNQQQTLQTLLLSTPQQYMINMQGTGIKNPTSLSPQINQFEAAHAQPASIDLVTLLQQNPQIKLQLHQTTQQQPQVVKVATPGTTFVVNNANTMLTHPVTPNTINSVTPNSGSQNVNSIKITQNKLQNDSSVLTATSTENGKIPIPSCENKPPKKRSSHNAIEKRYRCSINDKIVELKNMLMGSEQKLNKAAVLKKAIDYIKYITNVNKKLKNENAFLRKHLSQNKEISVRDLLQSGINFDQACSPHSSGIGSDVGSPDIEMTVNSPELSGYPTPPHSFPDSPNKMDEIISGKEVEVNMEKSSSGLNTDRKRAGMFLLMVSFLMLNPISYAFKGLKISQFRSVDYTTNYHARGILGTFDNQWLDWSFGSILTCTVNIFIMFLVLIKLLVYGETELEPHSDKFVKFWRHRKQADVNISQGDYIQAESNLKTCLVTVARPLPTSRFDYFCSILWGSFRIILGQFKILNWIRKKSQTITQNTKTTAKDIAEVYHLLNQLQLTEENLGNSYMAITCVLNSINYAEISNGELSKVILAEIYATAALQCKKLYPRALYLFMRFFMRKCRNIVKFDTNKQLAYLEWVCHPLGHDFIINEDLQYNESSIEEDYLEIYDKSTSGGGLVFLNHQFGEFMFRKALYSLVLPESSQFKNESKHFANPSTDSLEYIQLVRESCATKGRPGYDKVCNWWCDITAVAAYWYVGDDDAAKVLYPAVENIPNEYKKEEQLALLMFSSFCARRDFFMLDGNNVNKALTVSAGSVLQCCDKASQLLKESLICSKSELTLKSSFQLLACDWLLTTRTGIWQTLYCNNDITKRAPVDFLSAFEADLNSLRILARGHRGLASQVYLHEATVRMMAGACPTKTQQILRKTLRKRHNSKDNKSKQIKSGLRERAAALMLACRHLPHPLLSVPGQKVEMLQDAVAALETLGDKRGLRDCQKLLVKLGSVGNNAIVS